MMGEEKEINDSTWEVKLAQISDRPDIKKEVELLILISRTGYDSHTRPYKKYYLQKVKIYIPDTPEFFPLYLSVHEFQTFGMRKRGTKSQKLIFHNLFEGATQSTDIDAKNRSFTHARIKKLGKEQPIEAKEAIELVKSGKIYKVVENQIEQDFSEVWI